MKRVLLVTVLLILISEGTGSFLFRKLHLKESGFHAPFGFALILSVCQLLFYPAQLWNLPFRWIIVSASIVLAGALIITIREWKNVWKTLVSKKGLIILAAACIFSFVLSRCSVDMDFSDTSTYLNFVSVNVNIDHLNLFEAMNGIRGKEWDVWYLFEGYYHFASYLCWLVNIPYYLFHSAYQIPAMIPCIWGLGILYSAISSMAIINFIDAFHLKNKPLRICLTVFTLFFTNFAYWDISFAWYGNTWRNLYIACMTYSIYQWQKEDIEEWKTVLIICLMAGLACSGSFLFMAFAVLYGLAVYLFLHGKNALRDMMIIIIPMMLMVCAFATRVSVPLSIALFLVYFLLVLLRNSLLSNLINALDHFFTRYVRQVFLIGIPALFAIGSLALYMTGKSTVDYSYYFHDFLLMDMTKDYLFIHSGWIDNIMNVIRWIGIVLVLHDTGKKEDLFIKDFVIVLLVFFLNPLCMIMLVKTVAGIVFYRNWSTLFNVFIETYLFVKISERLSEKKLTVIALSTAMMVCTLTGNIASFLPSTGSGMQMGMYATYIRGGKEVDPVLKVPKEEADALEQLKYAVEHDGGQKSYHPELFADNIKVTDQPVLLSQSGATLSYVPEGYVVFSMRDNHAASLVKADAVVNQEFYEITRKHFSWETESEKPDYARTCHYIAAYDVDYILMDASNNPEYDYASDGCAVTIWSGDHYKVKRVNKDWNED